MALSTWPLIKFQRGSRSASASRVAKTALTAGGPNLRNQAVRTNLVRHLQNTLPQLKQPGLQSGPMPEQIIELLAEHHQAEEIEQQADCHNVSLSPGQPCSDEAYFDQKHRLEQAEESREAAAELHRQVEARAASAEAAAEAALQEAVELKAAAEAAGRGGRWARLRRAWRGE
jgi:hypothetical protein